MHRVSWERREGVGGGGGGGGEVFEGDNCEMNIDDCSSDPCQNNGTCEDGIAAYACLPRGLHKR